MFYFALAFLSTIICAIAVKKIAWHWKIVDYPDSQRKLHNKPVPLLGGLAIFFAFWAVVGYLACWTDLLAVNLTSRQLIFIFISSALIMLVGFFDDRYHLSPAARLPLSVLAVLLVMAGGMDFDGVTNPFGGTIGLDYWKIEMGYLGTFLVGADILIFLWLMGMMYTVKVLDGLDGLAAGVVSIGALMIAALASTAKFYQPDVVLLSLILAGCCLGFLLFNFYPAKIFLGEGGGLFLGLLLGVLAVVSGGKIATALLVMAVPVLDLARVIYVRWRRHQPIIRGDREHLHFRLLDLGWGHRQTVLFFYLVAFLFGATALFLPSGLKLIALITLALAMLTASLRLGEG